MDNLLSMKELMVSLRKIGGWHFAPYWWVLC